MARRPTKLEFHEHPVICPYCKANVVISSLMEFIIAARRTCPVCKREMLIDNGRAVKIAPDKKPSKQVRSRLSNPKD
jgi:Zn finger protein HypA/HybF involved in hydrogenase expression